MWSINWVTIYFISQTKIPLRVKENINYTGNVAQANRGQCYSTYKVLQHLPPLQCENFSVMSDYLRPHVTDFIFRGSRISADGHCSHEIKRRLLLGRKVMTNLDDIFKSRDITLPAKVHLVKAMVFPAVMYGCERWTIKKAERRRIDAFELWCWRRLLRVLWAARWSNQSILKEISPEYSLAGLILKLKHQYFGPLM